MKKVSFLIISSFLLSSMIMRSMDNTDEQIKYLGLVERRTEQERYPKLSVLQKTVDNALDQLVNSGQQDFEEVYTAYVNAQKVLFDEQMKIVQKIIAKKAQKRQSIKK